MFMPFQVLGMWLRGLLSLAIIGTAIFLFSQWYTNRDYVVVERFDEPAAGGQAPTDAEAPVAGQGNGERFRVVSWQFGLNRETAFLLGSLAFLAGPWEAAGCAIPSCGGDAAKMSLARRMDTSRSGFVAPTGVSLESFPTAPKTPIPSCFSMAGGWTAANGSTRNAS